MERRKQKSWFFTTLIDIVRHICKLLIYFFVFFSSFAGKGLGKEEQGISKAIKVNVKTDLAGVSFINMTCSFCFEIFALDVKFG